jgi:TRAP-type C4-dicarboxylate transport system permease small subunit
MAGHTIAAGQQAADTGWIALAIRLGDAIAWLCNRIAAVALGIIVAVNGANVFGRYFLASPISWAEELMVYLMVLIVFAGAATVTWQGRHIRIEAFEAMLNPRARKLVRWLVVIAAVAVLVTVGLASFDIVSMLHSFDQRSDALEVPMWIPQCVVLLGLFLNAALIVLRQVTSSKS